MSIIKPLGNCEACRDWELTRELIGVKLALCLRQFINVKANKSTTVLSIFSSPFHLDFFMYVGLSVQF